MHAQGDSLTCGHCTTLYYDTTYKTIAVPNVALDNYATLIPGVGLLQILNDPNRPKIGVRNHWSTESMTQCCTYHSTHHECVMRIKYKVVHP